MAEDIENFCPGYHQADTDLMHKEICWLRLVGEIVRVESSFKPGDFYRDGGNIYGGLMSISLDDSATEQAIADIKNPLKNLATGIQILAKYIAKYHLISSGGPDANGDYLGAAKYWSTLRTRRTYKFEYGQYKEISLGRREEIIARTQNYKNF